MKTTQNERKNGNWKYRETNWNKITLLQNKQIAYIKESNGHGYKINYLHRKVLR